MSASRRRWSTTWYVRFPGGSWPVSFTGLAPFGKRTVYRLIRLHLGDAQGPYEGRLPRGLELWPA